MGNLLKIVKGVNSGAEIVLAEGAVTFGSGEGCDIVLADATLAAEAFVLESAAGAVTLRILPDGEPGILSPYVIFAVGGMEFAIGPDGETWPELKREEPEPPPEPEAPAEAAPAEAPAEPEAAPEETPAAVVATDESKSGRGGCLWLALTVVLVILAFLLGLVLSRRHPSWFDRFQKAEAPAPAPAAVEEPAAETASGSLPDLVAGAGLVLETADDGTRTVRGNFARRADRLEFAAAAYRLDPDLKLDLADDETLRAGAEELVFLLTEGKIKVEAATNRTVTLVGRSKTREALLETVAALCADVNRVKTIDDTRVVCEDGERSLAPTAFKAASTSNPFAPPARRGLVPPKCPVAGVIVTPYPCLVMRDGSRLAPGATIGGWTVEGITETEVTIRNGEAEFKWKP